MQKKKIYFKIGKLYTPTHTPHKNDKKKRQRNKESVTRVYKNEMNKKNFI